MKKIISYIVIFICATFSGLAQEQSFKRHEFLVRGGAGSSFLLQDVSGAASKSGFGGNVGVGYNYFFSPNWGVGTGLEFGFYNSKTTVSNLSGSYDAVDPITSEDFIYRYEGSNFEEKQSATLLTIPILVNFQTGDKRIIYASAGMRIGVPVSKKYNQSASELTTSGFYPQFGYAFENVPQAGFVTIPNYTSSGDIDLKTSCMLTAEVGMKWRLTEKWGLYTGLYLDYGLNNIQKTSDKNVVQYQSQTPATIGTNSILNSSATSSIRTVSCGVRVGVSF